MTAADNGGSARFGPLSESGETSPPTLSLPAGAFHLLAMTAVSSERFAPGEFAAEPRRYSGQRRIGSVDVVRGAVMVLMALDHVRDFVSNQRFRPEDLTRATPALFATRWITHFCAPAFSLLAGVGIGLFIARGRGRKEAMRFLATRGLWLVLLDLTVSAIGFQFGFSLIPAFALVLWSLGWSMVVMAGVIWLPRSVVLAAAVVLIAGHNLLDGIRPDALWTFLHVPGFMIPGVLFIAYPLVPWVAVMALGYVLADVYQWDTTRRRRVLVRAGICLTVLFIIVRLLNRYGDPFPWLVQRTPALTVASFLNVTKYPPSLDFLLMTLGPILLALAVLDSAKGRIAGWLAVYGRVPLFYYLLHIYVGHVVAIVLGFLQGRQLIRIDVVSRPEAIPPWYGVSLPGVYLAWAIVVFAMYFPCRWYADFKQRHDHWLLRLT